MRDEKYNMTNSRHDTYISEERARMLNRIDPRQIQPNGRYPGYINGQPVGILKYEEIMYLRKKYNDPTIAAGYEFNGIKAFSVENLQTKKSTEPVRNPRQPRNPNEIQRREAAKAQQERQQTRQPSLRSVPNTVQRSTKRRKPKKYALQRTRRFVGYAIRKLEKDGKKIVVKIGSLALVVIIGASIWSGFKDKGTDITLDPGSSITMEEINVAGTQEDITSEITMEEQDLMEWRQQIIKEYAYKYNLDYTTVWYFFVGVTDNFQDPGYLYNYTIENISCKGSGQLYCSSEEEIISYTIRVLKQDPQRFGLTESQLARKSNDYIRPTTMEEYKQIIFKLCKVHNADPALIYAIIRQETGFNSEYFMNSNNPGGIYFDGNIAKFDTLEEGILELIHEVDKYERMGATTIEEIRDIHCPLNDKNDKQGLNYYWAPNVTQFYQEISPEFERMESAYQANQAVESSGIKR